MLDQKLYLGTYIKIYIAKHRKINTSESVCIHTDFHQQPLIRPFNLPNNSQVDKPMRNFLLNSNIWGGSNIWYRSALSVPLPSYGNKRNSERRPLNFVKHHSHGSNWKYACLRGFSRF